MGLKQMGQNSKLQNGLVGAWALRHAGWNTFWESIRSIFKATSRERS